MAKGGRSSNKDNKSGHGDKDGKSGGKGGKGGKGEGTSKFCKPEAVENGFCMIDGAPWKWNPEWKNPQTGKVHGWWEKQAANLAELVEKSLAPAQQQPPPTPIAAGAHVALPQAQIAELNKKLIESFYEGYADSMQKSLASAMEGL